LGLEASDDTPAILDSYSGFKRTVIDFCCIAQGQINERVAIQIADRVEMLLHQDGKQQHKQYWNISNTDILNHWTNFINRENSKFDINVDTWEIRVRAEFTWNLKNPPPIE
jgi:hypothetical protein